MATQVRTRSLQECAKQRAATDPMPVTSGSSHSSFRSAKSVR